MAGYSSTPLLKKLGIKPGAKIYIKGQPEQYWDWISPLPEKLVIVKQLQGDIDFIHFFVRSAI